MLVPGTLISDTYRVISKIGAGGGGIVYKAYHERLQTYVVVKQIRDRVKGILNSRAEVDILKNLRNSYLPRVYDFIEDEGEIYTVMEFIEGESLDKVLQREGAISRQEVLKWARQLADALAYLHSRTPAIIHGDIKPANIMVTPQRDICLIDFNVSLVFDQNMRHMAGVSKSYSPPEQYADIEIYNRLVKGSASVRAGGAMRFDPLGQTEILSEGAAGGRRQQSTEVITQTRDSQLTEQLFGRGIDERSDVYSLGATLYHMLVGGAPAHDFEAILPMCRYQDIASEGLCTIIDKMMELNPDRRYQNGVELKDALTNIYRLDSIYRRYHRRTHVMAVLLVLGYLAAAGLIVTGLRTMQREQRNAYYELVADVDACLDAGAYDDAEALIEDAIASMPARIEAYEREVLSLYQQGEYEECIRYGESLINSPEYTLETETDGELVGDILYVMGNAYYDEGDYSNALSLFEEALQYRTDNSAYYCDYAITLARTGNLDQADEILTQAEALGLSQDAVYLIQGEVAYANGEASAAADLARQTLSITETRSMQVRSVLLYLKACSGEDGSIPDDALEYASQWSERLGNMQVSERLAELYAQRGDYAEALDCMMELRNKGYVTYQLLENIEILYQQQDQLELAQETLNEMQESYPERYEVWMRQCYLDADVEQHKDVTERDYRDLQAHYEQAQMLYEESGETDTEMQQLETMVQELEDGGWFD